MMRKSIWIPLVVIFVVAILAFVAGRFFYYGAKANAYTPPERTRATVELEASAKSARLEAVDKPTVTRGVVVVDYAHSNALFIEELNVLLSKLVARGFDYELVLGANNNDEEEENGKKNNNDAEALADKLAYASSLILPLPRDEYSPAEIVAIERFVEKGGRVLIIGDPTRTVVVEALNSIAGAFGIIYANDYLYSLENNDNNYRNVVYTHFKKSPLTAGLTDGESKIIFYSGNSVYAPGYEIILGDETTHSSTSEGGRNLAAAALTTNDQVLALGDLTFFVEPYSAAENNGLLINNIAAFLSGGERDYELSDFPFFFNPTVDIVFDNTLVFNSQFDDSVKLKEALEKVDRTVSFADNIGQENDMIFIGRFDETAVISDYLKAGHITILAPDEKTEAEEALANAEKEADQNKVAQVNDESPDVEERFIDGRIQVEGMGELERGGSTLFYLHQEPERNVLIILSDNLDTNADAFELLLDHEFTDCQASPTIAVCQTQEPGGELPPSLRSYRIDTILIVADDSGRAREDAQTGALDYYNVLSSTYKVDTWTTSSDGYPGIGQLLEYDAIIWTTGDYWDDSIGEEGAALLAEYVEVGGNLIMSGASIAFDWEHSDFMSAVAHAKYQGVAEQFDLQVALADHPIAKDFNEGETITFVDTPSGEPLEIDIVSHTPEARVIFARGPQSDEAGAASVIAYEDNRAKIAYLAFPFYLLPAERQDLLLNNTLKWFTKKALPVPDDKDYKPFDSEEEQQPPEEEEETGEEENGQENGGENGEGDGNGNNNQDENS
ncbi:MAG: hypothetical protein JW953_11170 [Anaerolineae bacterium]|nr:hypothetical protein [Anaerolineae bacterium]